MCQTNLFLVELLLPLVYSAPYRAEVLVNLYLLFDSVLGGRLERDYLQKCQNVLIKGGKRNYRLPPVSNEDYDNFV